MRKVTRDIVRAFLNGEKRTIGNSSTCGQVLYLHGNAIARKQKDGLSISACGWKTSTTKERLNGIPGVSIQQKAGQWYLNEAKWNGAPTFIPMRKELIS